jgi:endonuclease I
MGPGTDLHLVRAADNSMNRRRGNLAFDDGGEIVIDGDGSTTCRRDDDSWEPRDAVKGDIARMLFYAAIRYERDPDLELTEEARGRRDKAPLHGVRSALLEWHMLDPVDAAERFRHERIVERQGNRNPFIDRPGLVLILWPSHGEDDPGQ